MIPLGNWEETNDELRNQIADLEDENADLAKENEQLRSALNAADTDIADYLFELDHLHAKHTETELDVEGLLTLVEYWQERAATAESARDAAVYTHTTAEQWMERAQELERENEEMFAENNRLRSAYDELYEDFANTSRELSQIHGEVAPGRPGDTVDFVREMVNELGKVRHESAKAQLEVRELGRENDELRSQLDESDRSHGELDFVYRNLLDSHIELKKALKTLSE